MYNLIDYLNYIKDNKLKSILNGVILWQIKILWI